MADPGGDKTQDATPHRRRQAREEGQVARSQDLGSAVLLLLGLMCLLFLGGGLIEYLGQYTRGQLGGAAWLRADGQFVAAEWTATLASLARHLLPIMGILFVGAVLVNMLQVGILFLPQKLAPDLTRIDPIKGFGRVFSLAGVMRLTFGVFKIAVIAGVALGSLYGERETILAMTGLAVPEIGRYLLEILLWTSLKIGLALFVLAILDFAFQRWKHEQDIRMTTQEVREEMKNLEGNPEVIARRKHVQRQVALNRLSSAVPKADVVVTNPTELAVAIQYEPETMAAPIVVAKGAGVIAGRIRKLAVEHNIPIIEKKPLAQALYREVAVNHPIPAEKYAAVAEVLAYVYQLKGKRLPKSRAA
jgi:flagellar biosynthesis protein FlhB